MTKFESNFFKYEKYVSSLLNKNKGRDFTIAKNIFSMEKEDVLQEGRIAIIEALNDYERIGDASKGSLSTFVYTYVNNKYKRILRDCKLSSNYRFDVPLEPCK